MKKIFKTSTILILILIVALGGKFITERKLNKINNEETKIVNEKVEDLNEGKESQEEEEKKEDKVNYLTLDVNEVKIPILMYHSISDSDPSNTLLVPINQFEEQVKWLSKEGFTPMLLDDVVKAFDTGKVPEKPVAITFDDGYADNYTEAYRILKKYNMKATFFIITKNIDADSWYMNSNMLKEMSNNGMGIENHTSIHIEFTNISRDDKVAIIKEGMNDLKEKVGVESKFVCYPVGKYDDETIEVEKELGIKAAVTTQNGISSLSDGLYSLKRVRISPMNIESFESIFSDFLN
jgi:peptidoglycan/xylan/chitin deacetylase (PgdA/CDA1 family)